MRNHPGKILQKEFLEPYNIKSFQLAKAIRVPPNRIFDILHEKRGITADTAMRFSRFFGTTPEFWMNLQTNYDISVAREQMQDTLARIQPLQTAEHRLAAAANAELP